ncbi:phytoene/squalene synthase family protein [Psychrobacillus sp. AK 1817]|uniref:Phytoene/squalene synthase family protein n=2 Tax=Bacillaceae TaxID=186817 RepID=A0ABR8RAI7_9BACI|nr:phytoene/squalene synthase family protein [Psychrobacillus faecigallinarum]QEY22989.1 phytoene/squalene synthase family protein [Psychrobacillus sp. AK 1817]QGM32678.1 phytoene/squalene synthase family protein [Bacillus sp. N3536]
MDMLKKTSRTFYIPITFLEPTLKKAVASAYLCMRAIDEIEDHETLDSQAKQRLLLETSKMLVNDFDKKEYEMLVAPYQETLPAVSLRLGDWLEICPKDLVETVKTYTAEMAEGMAKWTKKEWQVKTKEDLDEYTYYVAGLVGVMLSDLWKWNADIETDRDLAIAYGRGLQAVNILRNKEEDSERGVQFFPEGWTRADMFEYAEGNLAKADEYIKSINRKSILLFCKLPLALAHKTLKALKNGQEKMSRSEVEETVVEVQAEV